MTRGGRGCLCSALFCHARGCAADSRRTPIGSVHLPVDPREEMRRAVLLAITVAVVVARYIDIAEQDEKLMMMNDGVKSPYSVLDYNDYELMKNPAKLLPAIEQPRVYLTHPDRQLGDVDADTETPTSESIEDVEPKAERVEAKMDCVPRKEAEEILTLGKGIQEPQSEVEDNAFAGNATLGREGDMVEEPMKLRIVKPLCDD
ncbi:hypothetical protein QR680_009874 [Steinernema hermaphroditum]|uniref:Uncharacterized protein n=1 Tax=Steinernema hermaphroditum TaxID=289476 RepID=A0AA39ILY6_9BILA|nr:hypothetical protein QR680_009874 [Steinernema hermaphroditum]